jgi:hypothetical protein
VLLGWMGSSAVRANARLVRARWYCVYSAVSIGTSRLLPSLPPNMNRQTSAL